MVLFSYSAYMIEGVTLLPSVSISLENGIFWSDFLPETILLCEGAWPYRLENAQFNLVFHFQTVAIFCPAIFSKHI